MKLFRASGITILMIILSMFLVSCSGSNAGKTPTSPDSIESSSVPAFEEISDNPRNPVAVYDAVIDVHSGTFEITPVTRGLSFHFPLTNYFPNVLKITGFGMTPTFWADIKLSHPFPGSGIDAFDPRIIAILPSRPGVSLYYPSFNVYGNNSVVLSPDGYTSLFDNLGTGIPGNVNPFVSYFKAQPNRRWSSTGMTSETQRWYLDLDGFGGSIVFKLVVDVSSNYPAPPQPGIDNAPEPASIEAEIDNCLQPSGGTANIDVTCLDWQGQSGISGVWFEAPDLMDGIQTLAYTGPGPNSNEYVYHGTITNEKLAPEGEYHYLVKASDSASGISIYDEFTVSVFAEINFHLTEVKPTGLNLTPKDQFIEGNFLYLANSTNGFYIFDITNRLAPVALKWIDTPGDATGVYVSNGYAYVPDGAAGLEIIDVDPPESTRIVKNIPMNYSFDSWVSGNYAYVTDTTAGLKIIDITVPESASVIKTIATGGNAMGVQVIGEFAYVTASNTGLVVIDIEPASSAYVVKSIATTGGANSAVIQDGYAYVACSGNGLQIMDIDPLDTASIICTVDTPDWAFDLAVTNGYAFVADEISGINIVDITPPETASVVKVVDTPVNAISIGITGNYGYVMDYQAGIQILDITVPESASIVSSVNPSIKAFGIFVNDDYIFAADNNFGFEILDMNPFESSYMVRTVETPGNPDGIFASGEYLYVADGATGLTIVDVNPVESAYIVNAVNTPGTSCDLVVADGLACIADGYGGVQIVDVDPPESSSIIRSIDTEYAFDIQVQNGYAYVADYGSGLRIINVKSPQSASIVKTISMPGLAYGVDIQNDFAYVACDNYGLQIVDISNPATSRIVGSVDTPGIAYDVRVSGQYAYIADYINGLQIADIYPPEWAHIVTSLETWPLHSVNTRGNYIYLGAINNGLKIIRAW